MIIYAHHSQREEILKMQDLLQIEIICKELESLWDISFLEELLFDTLHKTSGIYVVNPKFSILEYKNFMDFIEYTQNKEQNFYFAPQINPQTSTQEPVWFYVKTLDSIQNFIVEFLYRNNKIGVQFRNILHQNLRGNPMSRTDIPKYLTNLDNHWILYQDKESSNVYLNEYIDIFYPHPANIHVALSNRCNLKCVMCPYHAPEYRKMQTSDFFDDSLYMDTATFEQIALYCAQRDIFLQIGQLDEPLVHPHFVDFVNIAKKHGTKINMTTNGTLLTNDIADIIAQSSFSGITFSLDAIDKASYKKIRGYNYDETLNNIEYLLHALKEHKKQLRIGVCFILQGENHAKKSQEFLEYWVCRVDFVKFHQLSVFELGKEGFFDMKHEESFRGHMYERYPCSIPYSVLFVLPEGKVTFCCNGMAQYSTTIAGGGAIIGDLGKESIENIWTGKNMKILRKELFGNTFNKFKICEKCPNWRQGEPSSSMIKLGDMNVKKVNIDYELVYERVQYEY